MPDDDATEPGEPPYRLSDFVVAVALVCLALMLGCLAPR